MSTFSKAVDPRRRAGFTLFEALVALVVAGLLLPTLGRALAGAWAASRTPLEIVSATALAGDAAAELGPVESPRGYRVARSSAAVEIEMLPSDVPPAPARSKSGKNQDGLDPDAVPASMRLAIPKSFNSTPAGGSAPPPALALRRVSVVVTTPSGRRIGLESLKLDAPRP